MKMVVKSFFLNLFTIERKRIQEEFRLSGIDERDEIREINNKKRDVLKESWFDFRRYLAVGVAYFGIVFVIVLTVFVKNPSILFSMEGVGYVGGLGYLLKWLSDDIKSYMEERKEIEEKYSEILISHLEKVKSGLK